MSVRHLRLLWLWGGLLALVLCLLFLPLSSTARAALMLLALTVVVAGLIYAGRRGGVSPEDIRWLNDLPEAPYRLPVVLVCGDMTIWPGENRLHRTAQGCWLKVATAELQQTVRHLLWQRPELGSQLAVMFSVWPVQHTDETALAARLHELRWQLTQVRRDCGRTVPLLLMSTVAGISVDEALWQTVRMEEPMRVWHDDDTPVSASAWLLQGNPAARHLTQVRMSAHARFVAETVLPVLTEEPADMPRLQPSMVLYRMAALSGGTAVADSLWHSWLARRTTLTGLPGWLPAASASDAAVLPDFVLPLLPQGGGVTPRSRFLRRAFCLFTLATVIALCSSGWNNRQLLHRLSFDIDHYNRIAMDNYGPKAAAVRVLRDDATLLDNWSRNGEPVNMSLGLYQGERLRMPILDAIRSYVPPPPPPKPIEKAIPKIVRLDSMSLFDTGRWALKPGSTKLLVNSLVGIKAKPGWLIVVAGHTDSTGDDKSNQVLSLKRAESVRDWMRDTGDVPESCFAVQGYGESRPVATNDTPEGRALNRRVEISLVPQANACQLPGNTRAPSQDDGALKNEMEK